MIGPIDPAGRTPEPSYGADEEGDVPLPQDGATTDPAAWVHVDDPDGDRHKSGKPGTA